MDEHVKQISDQARKLSKTDRIALIDDLLKSLDILDERVDAMWAEEVEQRIALLDTGQMHTRDASQVMIELRRARKI